MNQEYNTIPQFLEATTMIGTTSRSRFEKMRERKEALVAID